jgi:hypothetical protein
MNFRSGGSSCSSRSIVCSRTLHRLRRHRRLHHAPGDARRRVGQAGADGKQLPLNDDDRLFEIHVSRAPPARRPGTH